MIHVIFDKTAMGSQNKSKHIVADGRDLSQVVTLLQKTQRKQVIKEEIYFCILFMYFIPN